MLHLKRKMKYKSYNIIALIFFILNIIIILVYNDNIYGHHSFRQSQTALAVHWLDKNTGYIDYLPVLGFPWRLPMEFPMYQLIVSKIASLLNISHFYIGRIFSLVCLLCTYFSIIKIVPNKNLFTLVFFSTPLIFFYSTSYLIEMLCTCLLCINLVFFSEYRKVKSLINLLVVLISFCTLTLQKVTYGIPLIFIYLFYEILDTYRSKENILPMICKGALLCLACTPIILWQIYSGNVKELGYLTRLEVGSANTLWIFGSLEQRFNYSNWMKIIARFVVLGSGLLGVFWIIAGENKEQQQLRNIILIYVVISILLFFNLYFIHDYYLIPVIILFMLSVFTYRFSSSAINYMSIIILLNLFLSIYWVYPKLREPAPDVVDVIRIADKIGELQLSKDEFVIVFGNEWDSTLALKSGVHTVSIPSGTASKRIDPNEVISLSEELIGNKSLAGIVVCERWISNYNSNELAVYRKYFRFPEDLNGCVYYDP